MYKERRRSKEGRKERRKYNRKELTEIREKGLKEQKARKDRPKER